MNRKSLKQYLELCNNSGIDEIFLPERTGFTKETNKTVSDRNKSGASTSETPAEHEKPESIKLLDICRENYKDCRKCDLHRNRINFVYGEGNSSATLMIIGEGPGSDENKQGRPFVGKAGQLLTKMLNAINLEREEVYITNIVKCQPPGNRNPSPEEVSHCLPYLKEQIEIISPKIIVLLGKVAAVALFEAKEPMSVLRMKKYSFQGIETYITYHPAALLYNNSLKKYSWEDLKKFRSRYDTV